MNNYFEREYYLRTSDFDCYNRLRPACILDLFQDVAGIHAKELGCGYASLIEKQLLWVLVRVKFEVLQSVEMFQRVRVKTWPLAPSRAGFQREYTIEDENGGIIVKGSSDWVMIHSEKRRLVPTKDVYPLTEFLTQTAFEERISKIHDFEAEDKPYITRTTFTQTDINGHVNNTKYANFVLDAINLQPQDQIKTLQIDYRHEVVSGTTLSIYTNQEDKTILAKGKNQEDETMFACKIELM